MHAVLPFSAQPEEENEVCFSALEDSAGNSFHGRSVTAFLHTCGSVTDLTDFLSVCKMNMETPECCEEFEAGRWMKYPQNAKYRLNG